MLIHVQPEKVSEYWDFFSRAIMESVPPILQAQDELVNSQMLYSVLMENLNVWVYENEEQKMTFVTTTCFITDPVLQRRMMLIYSMTAVRKVEMTHWKESLTTLKKFADAHNASDIIAYSDNENIIKTIKKFGGKADLRLIEFTV